MALSRHIPITNELVFPAGAYAVGGVEQVVDFEASTREQRVQAHDRDSGLPTWAISVFDADPDARTKVVRVKIAARTPPVLPQAPAGSPFPAVAFEGLTATPYASEPDFAGAFGVHRFHREETEPGNAGKRCTRVVAAFVGAINELAMRKPAAEGARRSGRQSLRSGDPIVRPMLLPVADSTEPGPMTDRLMAAVIELVAALRAEMASDPRRIDRGPDRLLSIEQAAHALGIGRTALYSEIGAGRIRSIKVGRRRLVPSSAISEVASRQG